MDASALSQLLSPTGWALLSSLPPYDPDRTMALSERLTREGLAPELIAAALTQSRLRAKGRAKFDSFADGMLFTVAGLEQATRLSVGARHAQRYRQAGCESVADLTCGIGGDAMAMAALGLRVFAYEIDELTAAVATVNLRHFAEAQVRHGDGLAADLSEVDGVFADPARRTGRGTRRHDPASGTPPLDAVLAVRERVPALGVKVAPAIPHPAVPSGAEAQWVSVDGEVVEAGLWFGALAPDGPGRSALVVRGSSATEVRPPGEGVAPPETGPVGGYLYEPDGAVIRAGLVALVAEQVHGRLLDRTIAYVTSDTRVSSEIATGYRVLDVMPFSLKPLRAALRDRGVGRLTIKKRGTAVGPEQLRRQLDLRGDDEATIVLTRIGGAQHVLFVEAL